MQWGTSSYWQWCQNWPTHVKRGLHKKNLKRDLQKNPPLTTNRHAPAWTEANHVVEKSIKIDLHTSKGAYKNDLLKSKETCKRDRPLTMHSHAPTCEEAHHVSDKCVHKDHVRKNASRKTLKIDQKTSNETLKRVLFKSKNTYKKDPRLTMNRLTPTWDAANYLSTNCVHKDHIRNKTLKEDLENRPKRQKRPTKETHLWPWTAMHRRAMRHIIFVMYV